MILVPGTPVVSFIENAAISEHLAPEQILGDRALETLNRFDYPEGFSNGTFEHIEISS